jgi:hypothetical protein
MMVERRSTAMNDQQPCEFTCKTCGGHQLNVFRVWHILAGLDSETWQEWGPLEANHLWKFEFKEKMKAGKDRDRNNDSDSDSDGEVERWDFAEYTKDNSSSTPEEYEIFEPESDPEGDEYFVNCASCDREIEFGWSLPNRGGRIYPVECSDFIPAEVWPDPKYVNVWQRRGWLRKGHIQP